MTAQSQIKPVQLRPAKGDQMQELGAAIAKAVRTDLQEFEKRMQAEFDRRLAKLTEELQAMKSAMPEYKGVWDVQTRYSAGSMVTQAGSVWFARCAVPAGVKPGEDHNAWTLAVKRGRDGKDARSHERAAQ
jgi:hypothetical protein